MKRFKIFVQTKEKYRYIDQTKREVFNIKGEDFHDAVEKIKRFHLPSEYAKKAEYHFENLSPKQ